MGRGKGGSTSHGKRTPGGIQTSSAMKMSSVGDLSRNQIRDIDMSREAAGRVVAAQPAVANKVQDKKALQMQKRLNVFKQRFDKSRKENDGREFDPDMVGLDIERWERAFNQKAPDVKTLEQYKTHEDLHNAMMGFRTKREEELEKQSQDRDMIEKGLTRLGKEGAYEYFKATNPQALAHLAEGSNWCVQNPQVAEKYLKDKGEFTVIHKDGKPLVAIHADPEAPPDAWFKSTPDVWFHSDFSLRTGMNYTGSLEVKPVVLREDFDFINKYLESHNQKPITEEYAHIFDSRDALYDYALAEVNKDPASDASRALMMGYREEFPKDIEDKFAEDINRAIARVAVLRKRNPAIEDRVVEAGVFPVINYAMAIGGRFKRGEYLFAEAPDAAVEYSKNIIKGRFPEMEHVIAQDPHAAVVYARDILHKRFPEGEKAISGHSLASALYAEKVIGGRYPEGEAAILKSPFAILAYARGVIKGRWEEAEPTLIEGVLKSGKDWGVAIQYARDVLHGRFPGIEERIAQEAGAALQYCKLAIRGRFPEGYRHIAERNILKDKYFAQAYEKLTGVDLAAEVKAFEAQGLYRD